MIQNMIKIQKKSFDRSRKQGITASLKPLLPGENMRMLVAESRKQLRQIIAAQQIHLLITDVYGRARGRIFRKSRNILTVSDFLTPIPSLAENISQSPKGIKAIRRRI